MIEGLVYMLNLAGIALAKSEAEIQRLRAENDALRQQVPEPTG